MAEDKFNAAIDEDDPKGPKHTELWAFLMAADKLSTRQFLSS